MNRTTGCKQAFRDFENSWGNHPFFPDHGKVKNSLHLAVGSQAIASALVREDESGQQPVYFISKALQGAKLNYQKIENVHLRPHTHLSTTLLILSSSHYQSLDQPTHKRHSTENRLSWKNPIVGNQVIRIRSST